MKLSKETLNVLKNFASINSNILLTEGNTLMTITNQKNILAQTTVSESFPEQFGIYDIGEFLGALSLFNDPELTFDGNHVTISQGTSSIRYFGSEPNILTVPTTHMFDKIGEHFKDTVVEFTLTGEAIDNIKKISSVLKAQDVSFVSDGETLKMVIADKGNVSSNSYEVELGNSPNSSEFKINLTVDKLRVLPGDYTVSVSSKRSSRFKAVEGDLVYYIAVESDTEL